MPVVLMHYAGRLGAQKEHRDTIAFFGPVSPQKEDSPFFTRPVNLPSSSINSTLCVHNADEIYDNST